MKILTAILLSVAFVYKSTAQTKMPIKDDKIFYEQVDSTGNAMSDIYNKAKIWFAESFKDSKEVLQVEDKESGTLVGKGTYMFTQFVTPYVCSFTVKVNIKEGKYRIQLYDFDLVGGTARLHADLEKWNKKGSQKKITSNIHERMLSLIESFRQNQKAVAGSDDF